MCLSLCVFVLRAPIIFMPILERILLDFSTDSGAMISVMLCPIAGLHEQAISCKTSSSMSRLEDKCCGLQCDIDKSQLQFAVRTLPTETMHCCLASQYLVTIRQT